MKQKKRSGLSRITAFLLVMLLAVNLVIPGFAATDTDYPYLYWDDTKTFETGVLNYDYDKIPKYMLDSMILRALEFTGYDVQFLKENKLLFHPDYVGAALEANQYLLRDDPILTEIGYSTQGSPGGSVKTAETDWEKAWTVTGRVPNIPTHIENGMSCTSFIEYFYFAYLPNCEGKDVSKIISMYNIAHDRVANKTGTYPDTWTEIFEGEGGLISQGLANHFEIELSESQDQTAEYNAIWRDLHPGAVIRFGNESSPYVHYAIYAGTYNNLHYVIHVGNDRGPEIRIAETLAVENSSKKSWPIDFYDLKLEQKYGVIQVVKADADDDTKLAGAVFKATNRYTGREYAIGPTNKYGFALREDFPLGTYDVVEVVAPMGYALDPTVHEVVLSEEDSFKTLYQEIVNKKSYGSLQIQKDTNTGNNKAGWQFNVYKNTPVYSTAMNLESSGQMFRVTVSDYKGNSVTSDAVSMTTTPLKILRQPKNAVVEAGENVSYTVVAQGDGLTYLWQYKNPGKDWVSSTSSDGLTHTYSYTMRTDRDGRLSRCIITDKYGNSVTTDEVFMVLPSTLAVVTDPVNTTTAVGQTVTMAVTASGSNVNYQWQYSTNGTTWYNCTTSNHAGCSGATTATLNFTGNTAYDGRVYRCQVTDGTETLYSGSATSSIVTAIINTQPQTQIAALGNSVTFSIGATGSGLTYTWQGKARGSSSWTTMGNGTSYTTTLTEANEGMEIRCVISKDGKIVISDSAYLATASTLLITSQPQNHVDEEGTYATFEVEAQGVGLTYVWETSTDGGNTWTRLTNPINDEPYVSDANGKYLISKIQTGDYFVQEIDTGKDGWEYDLVAKPVTVTADHTAAAPAKVNFTNNELLGSLYIDKYTEDDKNLEGWEFAIYADEGCTQLVAGPLYTNDGGNHLFEGLTPGTYWVREEGHMDREIDALYYCSSENPQMVEIKAGETATVTFENKLKVGTLEIQKQTNTGNDKGGWKVNVYRGSVAAENLLPGSPFETDPETGKIVITDLPIATYIAVEVDDGKEMWVYDLEEKTAEVPHNGTGHITITNKQLGHGLIIKTTVNGGSAAGWQFNVWQDGTDPITVTTNDNGEFDLGLLAPGTYYVKEVGHETYDLRYWIMDTEVKVLTIETGKTSSVSFENVWMGELVIDKSAINSDLLAGWTGDLYLVNADGSETKIGTYTSDSNGRFAELLVAPGKYIFRETGHSDSSVVLTYWVIAGDKEIVVNAGTTASATITNTELGYGQILKDTTNGGIKEGWLFEVKNADGNALDGSPFTTNAEGKINLGLLPPGTYYVQEIGHASMTTEQLAYWVMDTEVKALVVTAGSTASVRFENQWQGMGRIKKEMPDGGSVAGWIFDVYRVSDNAYIGEFTSEENGDIALGYLIPGDYRVIERIPEGSLYLPVGGNEKILTVVAGEVSTLTVRNTLRSGEIILNKLDSSNDEALAFAKFLLEYLDGDVWKPVFQSDIVQVGGCRSEGLKDGCLVTDENGQIIFEGLHPDLEYRLTEVEAPDGYSLQAAPVFEGKLPTDTLSTEVTAYNSGIIVSPPTGVNAHFELLILFSAIVVILFFAMVALAIKEGMLTELIHKRRK